jgi:tetratricopeptide (TPR) repeat protein
MLDRLGPRHELTRAWILQNRANIRIQANDLDAALTLTRQALELKQRALPPGSADIAGSMDAEAEILFRRGDAAGALARSLQSGEILALAYGPRSPWLARNLSNRGEYLVAVGRLPEALSVFADALTRWETQLGPQHPYVAYPLTGIGVAHWKSGRAGEAIAPLERALHIREASEPDAGTVAETRFDLARALWDEGRDRRRARRLATTARSEYERTPALANKAREVADWLAAHPTP